MGSLTNIVVFLYITSAVLCTPFINKLQEGQEWPTRSSVKQPQTSAYQNNDQREGSIKETDDAITVEKAPENFFDKATSKAPEASVKATDKAPEHLPEKAPIEEEEIEGEKRRKVPEEGPKSDEEGDKTEKVDYTGCQVWKVVTSKNSDKKIINNLASQKLISSWGGNMTTIDILISPEYVANISNVLTSNKILYQIMIENLQDKIDEENPKLPENEDELEDRRGHRMTWNQYHRLKDIHDFMDYLAQTYPSIVSTKTIGKSAEGRNLKILRISDGKYTNKAVFIDGGIHAREWISPAVVTYFINQFAENFDTESEDIKNIDWYFLPVVNPDGYEYTHIADRLWRKNRNKPFLAQCAGTDLNRNFGYHWGEKGASKYACSEIYRGTGPFSEPESNAISNFMNNMGTEFSAYITYHSYGQYLLYPWGYDNQLPDDHQDLHKVATAMAAAIKSTGGSQYSVGSSSGLLYPASGGSDDWAKSLGIKYTYTIELSDTGRYGFVLPARYIVPVARENLAGLRVLAQQLNSAL